MAQSVEEFDPAAALASIGETRERLADKVAKGGWRYDLIYAALVAAGVAGQGLAVPLNVLADALTVVGLVLLMRWWLARTGVWVSGIMPRRARWVALGVGAVFCAASVYGAWQSWHGRPWVALPLAGVAGLAAFAGSRLWRQVYLGEIRAGVLADPQGQSKFGASWMLFGLGVVCCAGAGVVALVGSEDYLLGMLLGAGVTLLFSPLLFKLKRRLLGR